MTPKYLTSGVFSILLSSNNILDFELWFLPWCFLLYIINSVFFVLSFREQIVKYRDKFWQKFCNSCRALMMSISLQNSSVSSAYWNTLQDSIKFLFKSFMYRLKIRGPKIVPWETLWWSEIKLDSVLFTKVLLLWSYKSFQLPIQRNPNHTICSLNDRGW